MVQELDAAALAHYAPAARQIFAAVAALEHPDVERIHGVLRRYPRDGNSMFSKGQLARIYRYLVERGELQANEELLRRLTRKPVRTLSGVAPVTVLTKPYPCPGKCIFCPTDVRMPKSYLHDEPGAMRAEQYGFDPYDQTRGRIETLAGNGHGTDKIELLVLGGTWSSYPRDYQEWFVQRCFDAMNGCDSTSLSDAQRQNEDASCRNVGLVLETRPDHVTPEEIRHLRALGATKVQMGAQSLDDRILKLNRRGHSVEQTRQAMDLLRAAGFKLVLHWMPNLHGATLTSDREDFDRLFHDEGLRPDEIKIYSTALLRNAELYELFERDEYRPYDEKDLLELVLQCKLATPEYCRINRVYRDIPSGNIVAGSKMTNMRQYLQGTMRERGLHCLCIRCREVRGRIPAADELTLRERLYRTRHAQEQFLSFENAEGRLAGYLRLSLPDTPGSAGGVSLGMPELSDAALVREIHVYGPALALGQDGVARGTQHRGLGTALLREAEQRARAAGYARMAIIASIGTRRWYRERGYELEDTYMVRELS
jgi:elongator complex protein 3